MIEKMLTEQPKEEFRLMLYEIIKKFANKNDAEIQIEMRNGDTLFLNSEDKMEFDLSISFLKIKKIVQRTNFKKTKRENGSHSKPDVEYVPTENIQLIRLDDIVSVSLFNEVEELEDE